METPRARPIVHHVAVVLDAFGILLSESTQGISWESPRFPLKGCFKGDIRPHSGYVGLDVGSIFGFEEFLWAPSRGPLPSVKGFKSPDFGGGLQRSYKDSESGAHTRALRNNIYIHIHICFILYYMIWYYIMLFLLHYIIFYSILFYSILFYSIILYYIILYYIILYYIILYYIILYYIILDYIGLD